MKNLYFPKDKEKGKAKTMLKLVEEIGELSEAVLLDDLSKISEEIADVLAWTASLANLYNIDLEKVVYNKYQKKCPKCGNNPCTCENH